MIYNIVQKFLFPYLLYTGGHRSMKWKKYTIKTVTDAEDIIISTLYDIGLEGAQIEDKVPLTPIEKEQMNILSALGDAVRAVRVLAKEKEIQIFYEKGTEEWQLMGDYGRLRQMFIAALDNAIKYSHEKSKIVINTHKYTDAAVISIKDQGCGIPAADLQNIFTRFFRSKQQ